MRILHAAQKGIPIPDNLDDLVIPGEEPDPAPAGESAAEAADEPVPEFTTATVIRQVTEPAPETVIPPAAEPAPESDTTQEKPE